MDFDVLLEEGAAVGVEGWDFSWFEGRATEQRPSWGYARLLSRRLDRARSALDVQTGGGEVVARALEGTGRGPARLVVTESWPPNAAIAARRLSPLGAGVVRVPDDAAFPFRDGTFDLVSARHPVTVVWAEIARVLRPGGTFFSQMIGAGSNRELYEYLMGPQPGSWRRSPEAAAAGAGAAGLDVVDLRAEKLEVEFFDIAAVVHFLRKVPWTVPGFTVDGYRDRLRALHADIEREGRFLAHSQRFLIEARRPA